MITYQLNFSICNETLLFTYETDIGKEFSCPANEL
ncbi:hypothetical protein DFR30_2486 [Thiogranum longum]|uniref:Uncharacterized protein n=1 Tax=Thiogranum longum TaxID=1537524 RepID=A0A4R1HID4_9GAMM|nr:hypothetical protein DFR30_2486 [Thiogranum longum]